MLTEDLFSPRRRAQIIRSAIHAGTWKGTAAGVRIQITVSDQTDLLQQRVTWQAKYLGTADQGKTRNVYEALESISNWRRKLIWQRKPTENN